LNGSGVRVFSCSKTSIPVLWSTQPSPTRWVPGFLLGRVKWPERKVNRSPPSTAEVSNQWSYNSPPLYDFVALYTLTLHIYFPLSVRLVAEIENYFVTEVAPLLAAAYYQRASYASLR
jgi:hypothetical protein